MVSLWPRAVKRRRRLSGDFVALGDETKMPSHDLARRLLLGHRPRVRHPVLQRARRSGGAHGQVQHAALQAQLAARALEDEVDRLEAGVQREAAGRLGELLELELEPRVQRAVEPRSEIVY